jgi:hypothetical protein
MASSAFNCCLSTLLSWFLACCTSFKLTVCLTVQNKQLCKLTSSLSTHG